MSAKTEKFAKRAQNREASPYNPWKNRVEQWTSDGLMDEWVDGYKVSQKLEQCCIKCHVLRI